MSELNVITLMLRRGAPISGRVDQTEVKDERNERSEKKLGRVVGVVVGRKEDSLKSVADGGNFRRH